MHWREANNDIELHWAVAGTGQRMGVAAQFVLVFFFLALPVAANRSSLAITEDGQII